MGYMSRSAYLELKCCVSVGSENSPWMVKMLQLRSCGNLDPDPLFQEAPMGDTRVYKVHVLSVQN